MLVSIAIEKAFKKDDDDDDEVCVCVCATGTRSRAHMVVGVDDAETLRCGHVDEPALWFLVFGFGSMKTYQF